MTAGATTETAVAWELAQRTSIRAFRVGRYVLILAEGDLPNPGFEVDIQQSPLRIFPPQYNLVRRRLPGFFAQVVVPYRHAEVVLFPTDRPTVTVHHADGRDDVAIEEYGDDLAPLAALVSDGQPESGPSEPAEATGLSPRLSFDEAFADALSKLPPSTATHPDALTTIDVVHIGALFGGIAGFHHLVVRVRRSGD